MIQRRWFQVFNACRCWPVPAAGEWWTVLGVRSPPVMGWVPVLVSSHCRVLHNRCCPDSSPHRSREGAWNRVLRPPQEDTGCDNDVNITWSSFTVMWPRSRSPWTPRVTLHTLSPGRTRCTKSAGKNPTRSPHLPCTGTVQSHSGSKSTPTARLTFHQSSSESSITWTLSPGLREERRPSEGSNSSQTSIISSYKLLRIIQLLIKK